MSPLTIPRPHLMTLLPNLTFNPWFKVVSLRDSLTKALCIPFGPRILFTGMLQQVLAIVTVETNDYPMNALWLTLLETLVPTLSLRKLCRMVLNALWEITASWRVLQMSWKTPFTRATLFCLDMNFMTQT